MLGLPNRRVFLGTAAFLPWSAHGVRADSPYLDRLAVSTWSFHNYFPNTRYGPPKFPTEDLKVEEVIRRAKAKLGIRHYEMSSAHFASWEPGYLDELAGFLKDHDCRFIHLSDNMRGVNLARADAQAREADLRKFEQLIDIAQRLAIPSMRVNTGTPEVKNWDFQITIDCFRRLAKYGKERGVAIVVENHFGLSADPKNVVRILEAVGDNISACPDFGLFPSEAERAAGLELLFPYAKKVCSAKFHGFRDDGSTRDFDVKKCYDVLKRVKFPGWISLEYEGPFEPLPQLEQMLQRVRTWLS